MSSLFSLLVATSFNKQISYILQLRYYDMGKPALSFFGLDKKLVITAGINRIRECFIPHLFSLLFRKASLLRRTSSGSGVDCLWAACEALILSPLSLCPSPGIVEGPAVVA